MSGIKERVKHAQNQRIAAQEELANIDHNNIHSWLRHKAEYGLVKKVQSKKKTKKNTKK